jgi:hypothetical protein
MFTKIFRKDLLQLLLTIISLNFTIIATATINSSPKNIKDIYEIQEVSQYLTHKNCLVIFDIDNTLLFPKTDLGSDQWFSHMVEVQTKLGVDINIAIKTVLPLYFHVHFNIDLVPTEPELDTKLAQIYTRCHHAICLTARSLPLVPATLAELAKNNLEFPANPYAHMFPQPEHSFDLSHPHMYKNNVLFCGLNDKGTVLLAYLDHINYKPDLIIFIDDKAKNITSVELAVKQRKIEFVGLRYAGCDQKVQDFDHAVTQQELQEFLLKYPYNN